MKQLQLVLVRHGYSLGNEQHLLSGWSDVPLTDFGRQQLRQLRLSAEYPATEQYYSSDLCRCTETFHLLYGGRASLNGLLPQFREIYFGSLENSRETEVSSRQFFSAWLSGQPTGDGESFETFRTRIMNALTSLIRCCREEKVSSVTVVTHSGVIRTLLLTLRHLEPTAFPTLSTPNGLGYILTLDISQSQPQLIHDEPIPVRSSLAASDPSRKKRDLQPAKG